MTAYRKEEKTLTVVMTGAMRISNIKISLLKSKTEYYIPQKFFILSNSCTQKLVIVKML